MTLAGKTFFHGSPNWVSLKTNNVDIAKDFYATLFGWRYTRQDDFSATISCNYDRLDSPTRSYLATKDGEKVASLVEQPVGLFNRELPTSWETYIAVDDIEKVLSKVEEADGLVTEQTTKVGELGLSATIHDPGGAAICLWQANTHQGIEKTEGHGAPTWLELETNFVDEARKFYGQLFNWDTYDIWLPSDPYAPEWCYTIFTRTVEDVAGAIKPILKTSPASWCCCFEVDDVDETVRLARQNNGTVVTEPYDLPVGRQAVLMDPDQTLFSILSK